MSLYVTNDASKIQMYILWFCMIYIAKQVCVFNTSTTFLFKTHFENT